MLYWALVEEARHKHMSDEYINLYTIIVLLKLPDKHEITTVGSLTELVKDGQVKLTNTDLPNTYRRSTTETNMHPVGQYILLICPHSRIAFFKSSQVISSEDLETVRLDHFLSSLRNIIQTSNREMYFIATRSASISQRLIAQPHFYLSKFKIYRTTSYSNDHIRVVIFQFRPSRIFICRPQTKNFDILH